LRYLDHPLIKKNSLEYREYQLNLAFKALAQNTLISIPTGLGKTIIALLVIAEALNRFKGSCVLLAPTKPLVYQHFQTLKRHLNLEDIVFITGEERRISRLSKWSSKVICATPQTFKNDLPLLDPNIYSLLIFDEAHRAVGNYAYVDIAKTFKDLSPKTRILALTASLPDSKDKLDEIVKNLNIEKIEVRDEKSEDVKPYIKGTQIEWVNVEMPKVFKILSEKLKEILNDYLKILKEDKIIENKPTLKDLLKIKEEVKRGRDKIALLTCIRLYHALNLLQTQTLKAFLNFLDKAFERSRSLVTKELERDGRIKEIYELARGYALLEEEHPKLKKLKEILSNFEGKAIIFASYRDTVDKISEYLSNLGFKVRKLIGKGGVDGLSQEEQIKVLEEMKEGSFNILVATQVGEEGLDIAECNLVVFYDNVPSAIRFIQRRGRTGRKNPGKVIIMLTKGTLDEAFYWISKKRLKDGKALIRNLSKDYRLDDFLN